MCAHVHTTRLAFLEFREWCALKEHQEIWCLVQGTLTEIRFYCEWIKAASHRGSGVCVCVWVCSFLKCLLLVVSPSKNRIPADLQELNAFFFFLYSPVCVLSLSPHVKECSAGWGVEDMSAHSSAPRGHQSPPPFEPEGLNSQPSSAAVAPHPPFLLQFYILFSALKSQKKVQLEQSVQDDWTARERDWGNGEFLMVTLVHLTTFCSWKPSHSPCHCPSFTLWPL